jgi:hypothetical protein
MSFVRSLWSGVCSKSLRVGKLGGRGSCRAENGSDWRLANSEWRDGSEMTKVASWHAPMAVELDIRNRSCYSLARLLFGMDERNRQWTKEGECR